MKRILLCLTFFLSYALIAEEFDEISFYESAPAFRPFGLHGCYVNVQEAESTSEMDNHLRYIQSDAAFAYTHNYSPYSGVVFGMGWVGTVVRMQHNPDFEESNFNYISFALGAFTNSLCDWFWSANLSVLMDTQEISLSDYALYQGTLWGKYTINPCWEIDVGLLTEIGLSKSRIWPIIGFIYNYTPTTRLHLVYPVDMILEKDLCDFVTVSLAVRFLRNRHRVLADNPLPKAVFEYQATGVEFNLLFAPVNALSIQGFAGSTTGANLKVTDENNHNAVYYKFQGSLYAGISGQLSY